MTSPLEDTDPDDQPVYVISVAAELSGMHPQTLRIYERKGLVSPQRTAGNVRRYSARDVERLRAINAFARAQGITPVAAAMIMDLRERLDVAVERIAQLERERDAALASVDEVVDRAVADAHRSHRRELVRWQPPSALVTRRRR
jgi:MerR family transcriptional regulator/heat shock protein HspR